MAALARGDTDQTRSQPKSDAYTGMLIISLVALLAGAAFLYLDYSRYPSKEPPPVAKSPPTEKNK